jgi:ABC-type Zn uptake system ZnuABC Zn-binding protein ZnuA
LIVADKEKRDRKMKIHRQRLLSWLGVVVLLCALLSACGSPPEPGQPQDLAQLGSISLDAGEKLSIVATTNIVGDVVGQVGGDRIELTTLMSIGIDPHSYVPTPADSAAVHDAHIVFASGAGLESDLQQVFESAGGDAVRIYLSDGIQHRLTEGTLEEEGDGHEHDEGDIDPHVWFDVSNVIHWVETIEQALCALDPANAAAYQANAASYTQELEELDAWVVEQVAAIPQANRKLVTNHPSFGYLAGRYGLEQVGAVYPFSPSAEPSARDIALLEDTIHQYGVPAVFAESTVNPKLAQQVAADTGVKLVALYSGSLGAPGSGAETYILLIRYDVVAIASALK